MTNTSKTALRGAILTTGLVAITFIVWGSYTLREGNTSLAIVIFSLAGIGLLGGSLFISRQQKRLEQGEILTDELSTKQVYQAGYWTFASSFVMWSLLIPYADTMEPARYVIYIGMLGMVLIFGISYLIIKRTAFR